MFRSLVATAVLFLSLSASAQDMKGRSGAVTICKKSDNSVEVMSIAHFQARQIIGKDVNLGNSPKVTDRVDLAIEKLSKLNPYYYFNLKALSSALFSDNEYVIHIESVDHIPNRPDYSDILIPADCEVKQVMSYGATKGLFGLKPIFYVNRELWKNLDINTQAGVVLSVVLEVFLQTDSSKETRALVSVMSVDAPELLSSTSSFLKYMFDRSLQTATIRNVSDISTNPKDNLFDESGELLSSKASANTSIAMPNTSAVGDFDFIKVKDVINFYPGGNLKSITMGARDLVPVSLSLSYVYFNSGIKIQFHENGQFASGCLSQSSYVYSKDSMGDISENKSKEVIRCISSYTSGFLEKVTLAADYSYQLSSRFPTLMALGKTETTFYEDWAIKNITLAKDTLLKDEQGRQYQFRRGDNVHLTVVGKVVRSNLNKSF